MSRKSIRNPLFSSSKGKWALVGGLAAAAACIILAVNLVWILPDTDRDYSPAVAGLRPAAVSVPSLEEHALDGQVSEESAEITEPRPVTQENSSQDRQTIPGVQSETSDLLVRRDTPAHVSEVEKNAEPGSQPSHLASIERGAVTPGTSPKGSQQTGGPMSQVLLASPESSPVLGQVLSDTFSLDGLSLPSGSTLLTKTVLKTTMSPAVVHLSEGQTIELARNSSAYFERTEAGQIRVTVRSGLLAYRTGSGEIFTVPAGGELVFWQTEGPAVSRLVRGVVAVLLEEADQGQTLLQVNDTQRINLQNSILIRSGDGEPQEMEVHYIQSVEQSEGEHRVLVSAPLQKTFKPQSLIVQGDEVEKAIAAGATVVVGTTLAVKSLGGVAVAAGAAGIGAAASGATSGAQPLNNELRNGSPDGPED